MKLWLKGTVLAAASAAATAAFAADHRDGPAATAAPEADINDVYSWVTDNNEKLVLIQTVGGVPGIDNFSDAVQYVFHVGRGDAAPPANLVAPPPANTNIVCQFDSNTAIACYVGTPGEEAADLAVGDATPEAGLQSTEGSFRVHAGAHADPFYFHLAGFNAARGLVLAAVNGGLIGAADFHPSGCVMPATMNTPLSLVDPGLATKYGPATTVSGLLLGVLNGDINSDLACADLAACTGNPNQPGQFSVDTFATNKVLAIVIEIDKTAIAGSGEFFYVHASTHQKP